MHFLEDPDVISFVHMYDNVKRHRKNTFLFFGPAAVCVNDDSFFVQGRSNDESSAFSSAHLHHGISPGVRSQFSCIGSNVEFKIANE